MLNIYYRQARFRGSKLGNYHFSCSRKNGKIFIDFLMFSSKNCFKIDKNLKIVIYWKFFDNPYPIKNHMGRSVESGPISWSTFKKLKILKDPLHFWKYYHFVNFGVGHRPMRSNVATSLYMGNTYDFSSGFLL